MNFKTLARVSRGTSFVVAAGIGALYGAHLAQTTGNLYLAIAAGSVTFIGLAAAWHFVLTLGEQARRTESMAVAAVVGLALFLGAMALSGAAVTTMLGGTQALHSQQARALPEFEQALADAKARLDEQNVITNRVAQAAAATRNEAAEERRSGEGPIFRQLFSYAQSLDDLARQLDAEIRDVPAYQQGVAALDEARAALGDETRFPAALAAVSAAVRDMNGIDIAPAVYNAGLVEGERVNDLTRRLYADVERLAVEPVAVPVYEPVSREVAVLQGDAGLYWVRTAVIEGVPFILLILLMVAAREPLLRNQPDPEKVSDDEIRIREDNVIGIKGAAE